MVLALLAGLLTVPASAAEDSSGTFTVSYSSSIIPGSSSPSPSAGYTFSAKLPVSGVSFSADFGNTISSGQYSGTLRLGEFSFSPSELSGSISCYVSVQIRGLSASVGDLGPASYSFSSYAPRSVQAYYVNSDGQTGVGEASFDSFSAGLSTGYSFKFSTIADALTPISSIRLVPDDFFSYYLNISRTYGTVCIPSAQVYISSARLIATASSADTEVLESIADSITQQNEIMQAFYGDIIAILQAMDTKLGSLEEAADVMNGYLSQVVSSLGSLNSTASNIYTLLGTYLHYLESIAQTAEDIKSELASFHADFLTYIQLLISTVSSESDDIQAKMEEIYNLLIAYLNTVFGSAVTDDVTDGISGADNQLDAIEGIESNYTGSLSDKWQSIGISDFTIAPGLLSGVAWVSSWWTNLFEATGDFKVILTLALFFGVCGLLIGMISRASRRAGGGDGDA